MRDRSLKEIVWLLYRLGDTIFSTPAQEDDSLCRAYRVPHVKSGRCIVDSWGNGSFNSVDDRDSEDTSSTLREGKDVMLGRQAYGNADFHEEEVFSLSAAFEVIRHILLLTLQCIGQQRGNNGSSRCCVLFPLGKIWIEYQLKWKHCGFLQRKLMEEKFRTSLCKARSTAMPRMPRMVLLWI